MFRMNYANEVIEENLSFELSCVGIQQCVFTNCFDLLYDPTFGSMIQLQAVIPQDTILDSSMPEIPIQK